MAPQTIAGRYHVVRAAGRGGMGTVWLCHDDILGREVALKQVGTLPGESTPDLARALREARSSAALNHRNVVSIYDAVEDAESIWLVMEYVPSRTLSQLITEDGPISPERAAWLGAQIADGLAAAHMRGTIHRDVKPGNILVTADDVAKVSDFGIARTIGDSQLTRSGIVVGTPSYFSPELARGEEPGPPADVWALGATLYAAVEGRPPYDEQSNPIAMLGTIANQPPPTPEHAGFLGWPIGRMLDPDPASRWSMADAAHALHRLHEQHGDARREVTTAFAAPAAVATTTAEPEVHSLVGSEEPGPPEDEDDRYVAAAQPPRRRAWLPVLAVLGVLALVAVVGFRLLAGAEEPTDTPSATGSTERSRSATSRESPAESPSAEEETEASTPTPTPSLTPSLTPSSTPSVTPSVTPTTTAAAGSAAGMQSFATTYYGYLPSDTESSWSLLSPTYQSGTSYGRYRGFWSSIDDVSVTGTRPAGANAVDVFLTYFNNGGSEDEVRRLYLERSGDSYVITDDAVVG